MFARVERGPVVGRARRGVLYRSAKGIDGDGDGGARLAPLARPTARLLW